MGVGGYGRNPLFVRARHVQRCVKKCPHFQCVIHRFVLALNAGTNTLYTRVYIVSSLAGTGRTVCGGCVGVCVGLCVGGVGVCVCVGGGVKEREGEREGKEREREGERGRERDERDVLHVCI